MDNQDKQMREDESTQGEQPMPEEMAGDDQAAAQRYQNDFHESLDSTDQIGDPALMEEAENDYDGKDEMAEDEAKAAAEQTKPDLT